jgi:fatty acid desaturase
MTTPDQPPMPDDRPALNDHTRAFEERAQTLGREAEVAAERFATNPAVRDAADMASRMWGLVLLVAGLWFLAAFTLRLSLPNVAWADFWPLILILFGGFIVVRGLARRS